VREDLPTGTVTFLFTDVEGSTKLLHELGSEQYAEALAEHRRIVRAACAQQGGVEVDTQGDAFFFAFTTASGAMRAAETIVGDLAPGPIRLRMGLHTGTPLVTEEGYVGPDVVRAARIAASGHGGQVLISAETVESVRLHDSASALLLRDLGEHRFKDLLAAERVFQLGDGDFSRLRSLYQTNLPVPATSFLGRERELAEVSERLLREQVRLLTLTGPGGTGKTRLAVQAGAEASDSFPDGIWWVPLASLRDHRLIWSSLAQVLGVEGEPGTELAESVLRRVRGRQMLLVLDNAEHLLPGAAREIARLLDAVRTTIVVTSRERIQIQGEHVYRVPPLEDDDGVALFLARARALGSDAVASTSVTEICARLDNLPLALELAAARTVVFSAEQLLDRLSERLDLLSGGRDADPRQQTLRATIEWSYDLLQPGEQKLFRGLSIFANECTYTAADVVCDADPGTLQALLDKSLLRRSGGEQPRYWMLETIREFAADRLVGESENAAVRRRHAEHYLGVALSAGLAPDVDGQMRHDLVIPERDNIRGALAWALESDERELGLELVVALENYWATNGPQEGVEWVQELLADAAGVPDRLVARALRVQGGMHNILGRRDLAEELWQEALAIARAQADERGVAILLHRLATAAIQRGDLPRVRTLAEESLALHRRSGFAKGEAQAVTSLAEVAAAEGDLEHALVLLEESLRLSVVAGFRWWQSGALARMGATLSAMGRLEEADVKVQDALRLSSAMGDRRGVFYELALLAEISARSGDQRRAGVLWGAAEAENERASVDRWLHGRVDRERLLSHADSDFGLGQKVGRALPLEDAVALALEAPSGVT
jgi:predicted ATPase/class 3 adenylate cyclase